MLTESMLSVLLDSSSSKTLATHGDAGLNVVPVSSVRVVDGKIWLIDYFFGKTRSNLLSSSTVSLVFWNGLVGWQAKCSFSYVTSGETFDSAVKWIASVHPTRTVCGLVVLDVSEIFPVGIEGKV